MTAVRELTAVHLDAVERIYAQVFDAPLNRRLVLSIAANGGHLLGAFAADELLGYGLSFLGRDGTQSYAYSQTVAVVPAAQGRGIGRAIKQAQRAAVLGDGLDRMRWSFDPAQVRNAHVNTDVLGARIRWLHRDFYGAGSDRFVVEWELADPPAPPDWEVPDLAPGQAKDIGGAVAIAVAPSAPLPLAAFGEALDAGLVGASCRRLDQSTTVYLFVPR